MTSRPSLFAIRRVVLLALCAVGTGACSDPAECTTEVTDGTASYTGKAIGKAPTADLRRESLRSACKQKCTAEKSSSIEGCTAACATDVASQKLGGRTTCKGK